MIQDGHGGPVTEAVFMVSYANREEKGSDVNVAAHLLPDVPVGVVNPSRNYLAGDLRGAATAGAGRHWWARLSVTDLQNSQLPDPAGQYRRPDGW
jgi:hypothetical protein